MITIRKALEFKEVLRRWIESKPENSKTDIAKHYYLVLPSVNKAIQPYYDMLRESNEEMTKVKIEYASKVSIEEVTQEGAPLRWKFEYSDTKKLLERNVILKRMMEEGKSKEDVLLAQEVEIEPSFSPTRAPRQFGFDEYLEELCTDIILEKKSTIEIVK